MSQEDIAAHFPPTFVQDPNRIDPIMEAQRPVWALTEEPGLVREAAELGVLTEGELVLSCLAGWERQRGIDGRHQSPDEESPLMSLQQFLALRAQNGYKPDETAATARWISRTPDGQPSDYELLAAEALQQRPKPMRRPGTEVH